MVPSVGVKSLNDLLSKDRRVNWFYDFYTPSGVAIDGMMPHACKSPLGRQYQTPSKDHIVELIQPVSKMLSYLSSSEDLKNGYHLKDMLRKSCYVYGSENIFNRFSNLVQKCLEAEKEIDILNNVNELALDNVNDITRGTPVAQFGPREIDCKSLLYRPISTCLGYLGWTKKWESSSGFVVISGLKRLMGKKAYRNGRPSSFHPIKWALAVACEMRMKVYAVGGRSRQRVIRGNIHDYIAKPCLINCITQALELSMRFKLSRLVLLSCGMWKPRLRRGDINMPTAYMVLGDFKSAKPFVLREMEFLENQRNLDSEERRTLAQYYYALGIAYYSEWEDSGYQDTPSLQRAEEWLLRVSPYPENSIACGPLIQIYEAKKNYRAILNTCEGHVNAIKGPPLRSALQFRMNQVNAVLQCYSPSQATHYCRKSEEESKDMASRLAFRFGTIVSQIIQGGDKRKLLNLLNFTLKEGTKEVSKLQILYFIEDIFLFQYQNNWIDDAIKSLEVADLIMESRVQYVDPERLKALNGFHAAICYLNISSGPVECHALLDNVANAVKICLLPANKKSCHEIYIAALQALSKIAIVRPYQFGMSPFIMQHRNAPFEIQHSKHVQNSLKFALFHMLAHYYKLTISFYLTHKLEVMSTHLITLLGIFPDQISHPLLSNQLHSIYFKIIYWIASLIEIPGISTIKADTMQRFNHLTDPVRYHVVHEHVNGKILHFFEFKFRSVTKAIWRSCF